MGCDHGAQGLDAIRTGRLVGRFPNKWPVDADREEEPISFWLLTAIYLAVGLTFTIAGVGMIVDRIAAAA